MWIRFLEKTPPLAPVMPDNPRGKGAQQATCKNLGVLILEEPEGQQSGDHTSEVKLEEEDLIPNLSLYS